MHPRPAVSPSVSLFLSQSVSALPMPSLSLPLSSPPSLPPQPAGCPEAAAVLNGPLVPDHTRPLGSPRDKPWQPAALKGQLPERRGGRGTACTPKPHPSQRWKNCCAGRGGRAPHPDTPNPMWSEGWTPGCVALPGGEEGARMVGL